MKNKVLAMFLILTMLSLGVKTYATTGRADVRWTGNRA